MRKLFLFFSAAMLAVGVSNGQSSSKEINAIKRNPLYMYSEATMDSEAEAREVADELLMQQVREYIESKRKLNQADNVLIKDIKSKSESLSMMRGSMHRVFVYVKKSDIEGVNNTTVINTGSGTTITVTDSPASIVEVQAVPQSTPPPIIEEVREERTSLPQADSQLVKEAIIDPSDVAVPETVESPLKGWQQEAVNTLLECQDINAVKARLNRMKAEYKVKRHGTAANCPAPNEVFWAFFDAGGHLITILGPGTQGHIDYRTMQLSSTDAYKNMNALWFNLAK